MKNDRQKAKELQDSLKQEAEQRIAAKLPPPADHLPEVHADEQRIQKHDALELAEKTKADSVHKKWQLSLSNRKTVWTSEAVILRDVDGGRYQRPAFGNTTVIIGDGYHAHAEDFQSGTRIRVTAEVLLPGEKVQDV
jgi:hypothetical protein